jgi:CRP-like cAMP-binding protein
MSSSVPASFLNQICVFCLRGRSLTDAKETIPTTYCLRYKKGDQIFKQNDFGISIYKIVSGKVLIFRECDEVEVPIAILGKGSIMGEMIFFLKATEVRSASAKALEDSEIEVTHPMALLKEYEVSAPILKLMARQVLNRLTRMNRFIDRLVVNEQEKPENLRSSLSLWKSNRRFYRKRVKLTCKYTSKTRITRYDPALEGTITNMSMTGLGLEIDPRNEKVIPHEIGEVFQVETILPNAKELKLFCTLVRSSKGRGYISLGMTYVELSDDDRKILGFFLLPA